MKRYIIIILALVAFCGASQHVEAKKNKEGVIRAKIDSLKMQRNADYMSIKLFMDFEDVKVRSNRAMLYTPRLVSDSDTIVLKSIGIYGRTRYLQQKRYSKNHGRVDSLLPFILQEYFVHLCNCRTDLIKIHQNLTSTLIQNRRNPLHQPI